MDDRATTYFGMGDWPRNYFALALDCPGPVIYALDVSRRQYWHSFKPYDWTITEAATLRKVEIIFELIK